MIDPDDPDLDGEYWELKVWLFGWICFVGFVLFGCIWFLSP